jgi:hypothetical protein
MAASQDHRDRLRALMLRLAKRQIVYHAKVSAGLGFCYFLPLARNAGKTPLSCLPSGVNQVQRVTGPHRVVQLQC